MATRAPDTFVKTLVLALWVGTVALGSFSQAHAQAAPDPAPDGASEDKRPRSRDPRRVAIDARLQTIRPSSTQLSMAPGDTVFLESSLRVPAGRLRGPKSDYEAVVSGIIAPEGVVVHRRAHRFSLRTRGTDVEVRFVYAVHVEPGTLVGGPVQLDLTVVERRGLANTMAKKAIKHRIRLDPVRPAPEDLAADFYGYRFYKRRAERRRKALLRAGLRLPMPDEKRLPPLDRASAKVAAQVYQFARERRLLWVAHRHLVAARQHPDPEVQRLAQAFLQNLDRPRQAWDGVPSIPLVARPPDRAEGADAFTPSARAEGADAFTPSARAEAAGEPPSSADPSRPKRLEPSLEYELGTERTPPPAEPPRRPIEPEPPVEVEPPKNPEPTDEEENLDEVIYEDDPFSDQPRRRLTPIPSYYRGLLLDDGNIGHGGGIRALFASIETRESADTVSLFFFAQAAVTRDLGIELTVPTQYLDITSFPGDRNPPAQYEFGNPLLAVKYRFHLPKVQGRRPALTVRARWGVPVAPLHGIPATELNVEEFTREVNFADTYAFFLENHSLGLGANFAWRWKWLYTGVQLYGDAFIPVGESSQNTAFTSVSYGASVGVLPFGDWVGFFAEGRGTSLFIGGGRNEFFTYLGARGRVFDRFEPAVWIAVPVGSVQDVSPIQFGFELRFAYDIDGVEEPDRIRREQDILE